MDNRSYYDEFAGWYEKERGRGYHQLIDDLEIEVVERYSRGAAVLEAGCGTGLLLDRVARSADEAWGVDLSAGMLAKARARHLNVIQASVTSLPFPAERFDVVYSFKVLAHVEQIREAVAEMARVTRRHGYLVLEFYNPRSLRYLVKRLKTPTAVSPTVNDEAVYTRYDDVDTAVSYLPSDVHLVSLRGVRIATPFAGVHAVPVAGPMLGKLERWLADRPLARKLGGFQIIVAQKA
jgi:SAM-dependent methyltransferase